MRARRCGNLDRIQIVKGWIDATGARQEKVYDVVWSDRRVPGADGKLHDLRPAYLSITERAPAIYSVLWKAPATGERRLAVYPRLPLSPSLSS